MVVKRRRGRCENGIVDNARRHFVGVLFDGTRRLEFRDETSNILRRWSRRHFSDRWLKVIDDRRRMGPMNFLVLELCRDGFHRWTDLRGVGLTANGTDLRGNVVRSARGRRVD